MRKGNTNIEILKLLYPPRCPVCDRMVSGSGVCDICRQYGRPEYVREPLCKICGKPLENQRQERCFDCQRKKHEFVQGRAVFVYRGMEEAMHRFKDENRRKYAEFFAEEMAEMLRPHVYHWQTELIVPIPVHVRKKQKRGFNQAELLSRRLADLLGLPENHRDLYRKKNTKAQKQLDDRERFLNLSDAFGVKDAGAFSGKRILLVDDIYTTGSTMDEAARTLKEAGAKEVFCSCVCVGKGH